METTLNELIDKTLKHLAILELTDGTLKSYKTRAFAPVSKLYSEKYGNIFQREYLYSLKEVFHKQYEDGKISKKTLNWRWRGIHVLLEIYDNDCFNWKVYSQKTKPPLTESYEIVLHDFIGGLSASIKRKQIYESILRRFLYSAIQKNIFTLSEITPLAVKDFIMEISKTRAKSMEDVMTALRKFFSYLNQTSQNDASFWQLLSAPRTRDHHVRPCMKTDEINQMLYQIDRTTTKGKRDFAILSLAATTGLRAGDIASLKLTDIRWNTMELCLMQGKTDRILTLPISKNVLTAIADYILNGRPKTTDPHLFIKSCAPYTGLQDGVSIAGIFRKYLKSADIQHTFNDGKTMQGLRRAIGTQMVSEKVAVTTVAQVLGHTGIRATKQYISLDLKGLKKCVIGFESLGGVQR